jgi:methylated-DNA-[protein]-cysteine S-methyltransferase
MMRNLRNSSGHTYRKMFFTYYSSPLGEMMIAGDSEAICGVWFCGQKHFPSSDFIRNDDLTIFGQVRKWLDDYFSGMDPEIDFKLKIEGSEFQLKVWRILQEIPYGETMTYGEIARRISPQMSAQAVGGAVGRNPISIIIPCHRVLGAKGKLTGYAGGIDRKMRLLDLENISWER